MSYKVAIVKALSKLGMNGTENPDAKHNQGRMIGEAFLWDEVAAYAKSKSDAAWEVLEKEGLAPTKDEVEPSTEREFAFSPSFVGVVKTSKPIKRFDADVFAAALSKGKYHVPVSYTKEALNDARVDGKPRTEFKIIERG